MRPDDSDVASPEKTWPTPPAYQWKKISSNFQFTSKLIFFTMDNNYYLYVCVHMHQSILLHVHTKARGQWQMPFLYLPLPFLVRHGLSLNTELTS